MNNPFEIEDLRQYIFSFLRKEPQAICRVCNKVLIWDRKITEYVHWNYPPSAFFARKNGHYCMSCMRLSMPSVGCLIV